MKIEKLNFDELTEFEKDIEFYSKYANFLRISYDNGEIELHSDYMEPEDATFLRDLSWVAKAIARAYNDGKNAGLER